MNIFENKFVKAIGETHDIITYKDGTVVDTGWSRNTIVIGLNKLLSAMLKGDPTYPGIKYWAIGSSDTVPTVNDVGCTTEIARKAIPSDAISYRNSNGTVSSAPTNILQVTLTFAQDEANGTWKEFSIFGGNATASLGSGIAINHKVHGVITKTNEMTVERTIRFTFE